MATITYVRQSHCPTVEHLGVVLLVDSRGQLARLRAAKLLRGAATEGLLRGDTMAVGGLAALTSLGEFLSP